MENLNTYLNITERDVDLLLLEELLVSPSFSNWLVSEVYREPLTISAVKAWHSVSDALLGESDLVLRFAMPSGVIETVLIENKIDAQAQNEQGQRYKLRGDKGIASGNWVKFKTCLIAPQRYLDSNSEPYDASISYEQVIAFFEEKGDVRSQYRAAFLLEAVEKNRRGYQSVVCERMTSFAASYLDFVSRHYPELNPETVKPRAAGHDWIHFYPVPNQKNIAIVHQVRGQWIKIIYHGQHDRFDEIASTFKDVNNLQLTVKQSGKSVTVAVRAPHIDLAFNTFDEVTQQVQESVAMAMELKSRL